MKKFIVAVRSRLEDRVGRKRSGVCACAMRSSISLALSGLISLVATASFACAEDTVIKGVSAARLFELAERESDVETVQNIYRALLHDPNADIRNEARFRLAKLLVRMRRPDEAAVLYRAILDERPGAARVRLELAALLAQMGDLAAARRQLRQAQAGGLPPEVAQAVNKYVAALRSFKPWGGSFEVTLAPDSNINRATDTRTLDTVIAPLVLSRDSRQRSGLGLKGSGQLYLRVGIDKDLSLVPRVSGQGSFYRASQFDDVSGSAQIGLEWRLAKDRVTPSAGYTERWYGGSPYARTKSLSIDWLHPTGTRSQLDTNLTFNPVHYAQNHLQDGTIYSASASYERALSARSGGSVSVSATRQTAEDPGYATVSGAVGIVYWHDLGKITVFGTGTASRLDADKKLFLYLDRRKEWYARGGLGAIFRQVQVAGFSPVLRVAYERNLSTVGLYDYRRVVTDAGITRSF